MNFQVAAGEKSDYEDLATKNRRLLHDILRDEQRKIAGAYVLVNT